MVRELETIGMFSCGTIKNNSKFFRMGFDLQKYSILGDSSLSFLLSVQYFYYGFLVWILQMKPPHMPFCTILYKFNINSWAFAFIYEKHDDFVGERHGDCEHIINENASGIHAFEKIVEIGGVSI